MRDLLACPHCGTIFLKPTQGQPAQCHWGECVGAPLRKATTGDLAAWSFGKTIQEPRNEPPRLPYRCGTSLLGMPDDFVARRDALWTAMERRHIAWVRAHLMPRPEWLQWVERLEIAHARTAELNTPGSRLERVFTALVEADQSRPMAEVIIVDWTKRR
jgi:hypothetical protein